MEDLEETQDIYEDALPGVVPLDAGKSSSNDKGNESVVEGIMLISSRKISGNKKPMYGTKQFLIK